MNLDELLAQQKPPEQIELSPADLARFFWKYRGLLKNQERDQSFWAATNQNLKTAYEKLDEKDRQLAQAYGIIQEDLAVAQQVQSALIPTPPEDFKRLLDIAVFHGQLSEVGGDYYDYFRSEDRDAADVNCAEHRVRMAVGVFDISGHGVSAALVMAYLKAMFMQAMDQQASPKAVVEWVNKASIEFLRKVKKYSTVNFVELYDDHLRYVSGGGFGLLVRQGEAHLFERKDHFLGLRDRPFREHRLPFEASDLVALYTDGIVEAQDAEGNDFTTKRLNQLILDNAARPVDSIVERCLTAYRSFRDKDIDDITLLVMRRKAGR